LQTPFPSPRQQRRKEYIRAASPWDWHALSSRRQRDNGASIRNFFCFKPNEPCDRDIVRMHRKHKALFRAQVAGIAAAYATDWSLNPILA